MATHNVTKPVTHGPETSRSRLTPCQIWHFRQIFVLASVPGAARAAAKAHLPDAKGLWHKEDEVWEDVGQGALTLRKPSYWPAWAHRMALAGIVLAGLGAQAAAQTQSSVPYASWLEEVKREAATRGISQRTISAALNGWQPVGRILELDQRQAEFSQTFWTYLNRAVSEQRIERGKTLLRKHAKLLNKIRWQYGVQPRFLVAFWGLESNYGDNTGGFRVIDALATLAYDPRRADFFRNELFSALRILDEGHIPLSSMTGSWAGAMGQVQFMPSTFIGHAVDQNRDGRRDIWTNLPDIFGSAANYLKAIGWKGDQKWGREVRLPQGFDWNLSSLKIEKTVSEWAALGVRRADGGALPSANVSGSIILPGGYRGPAFLVYENFRATMTWNRSVNYALAVGHLSDRLIGQGPLLTPKPANDRPMSRAEVLEMQRILLSLGFEVGEPDGVVGSRTREALRGFQKSAGLPPDGYPTPDLLSKLRQARGG